MSRSRIQCYVVCALLALITLLLYLPVRNFSFVDCDDPDYITENPIVQAGLTWPGVKWAFTTCSASNWHPLTWLSLMLDCQLFGLNAGGSHLVNVFFHAANTVLLFLLWLRLTGAFWRSALIAALFAWHPLHVESVAWVAERKDVLSVFFGMLALLAYVQYARQRGRATGPGGSSTGAMISYALALLFFSLGLMAKPMLVTWPFVFLLLDYWPLQRAPRFELRFSHWFQLVLEKWPFFALSGAACVMTMLAQQQGQSVVSLETFPLSWRIGNAAMAYVKYLLESLYPVNLAVIYPLPREMAWGQVATAIILLAVITWLVWRARVSRPYLLTGWFWYLGMLVPVIGLVQVGLQAMADRYTYLSFIGIFVGAVFGLGALANQLRLKPIVTIPVASIVLAGCLWVTAGQLRYWRNSETLFEHAVAVTKDNPIAEDSLGAALGEAGQLPGAIQHLRAALRLKPAFIELVKTHNNLGNFLLRTGQPQEAIEHFQEALRLKPDFAPAYNNLGAALAQTGQSQEAIDQFREALRLKPGWAMARNNLGDALIKSGQVLFQKGQMNQAIASLQEGLQIHPGNVGACNCLGYIFLSRGQAGEAAAYFQQVLESQPNDIGAQNNLAWVLATCPDASLRNGVKAVELAQQANQLSGGQNPALLDTLAAAYAEAGNFPEAVTTAQKALQLIEPQTNAASAVNDLRRQLKCYQAGSPYRDRSLTNTQAATYPNP